MPIFKCANCGKNFQGRNYKDRNTHQKFCSKECRKEYENVTLICSECGKKYTVCKCRASVIHFCRECIEKHKETLYKNRINKVLSKEERKKKMDNRNKYYFEDDILILEVNTIYTNKTYKVLLDKEDLEKVKQYIWRISNNYVIAKKGYIKLHRLITNCPDNLVVDHINHNPLDNRKCNLRVCTQEENAQNVEGKYLRCVSVTNRLNQTFKYYKVSFMHAGKCKAKYFPFNNEGLKKANEYIQEIKKQYRTFKSGGF